MNLFRIIAEFFLIYVLYKLIFDFIIPIYQSTGKIKSQLNEMQSRMQNDLNRSKNQPQPQPAEKEGDYIDFEEVKK